MKHLVYVLFVITLIACDERDRDNSNNEYGGETLDCRRGSPCNDGFNCQLNGINEYECMPNGTDLGMLGIDAEIDDGDGGSDTSSLDESVLDMNVSDGSSPMDAALTPNYDGPMKKGIAIHQRTYDWSEKVAAVKPFWSYSWGSKRSLFQPNGIEFVPMIWSGSINEELAEYLRTQFAAGEIKYLLGYNEPDGEQQANMSVDRALELWPQLEATGIPLVSPSPVHYDNEWMIEFMRRAGETNLRIDYLAFHWYGGTDAQYFLDLLDRVYEKYQLPIWITEFAPADWEANSRDNNRMRPEWVLEFMRTVLPELDRRDYIVRYAWYSDYSSNQLWTSALFDDEARLTPLGEFYAQHSANPVAGPGKPYPTPVNQEGNLLKNGGFDLGDNGDWGGYEKRFMTIDMTETHEGAFCASLRGGFSSAIDQRVILEAGRTYRVTVHTRWSSMPNQPKSVGLERNGELDRVFSPGFDSTEWQQTSFTYTPTETDEHVLWIWTGADEPATLFIDTVSIRLEE